MVYIREAHASDTWPLKYSFERPCPTSLSQRVEYAAECARALGFANAGFRLLADPMDDRFNSAFGAWPTAYYALDRRGRLVFVGEGKGSEFGYDVREVFGFVSRFCRDFRQADEVA